MARSGVVYVMDCGDGLVKVGFSKRPTRRADDLGLIVRHTSDWHEQAELIEKAAHRLLKLAGHHSRNEIFTASIEDAVAAINQAFDLAERGELKTVVLPPQRTKHVINLALDPVLLERLDEWLAAQEFPPTKTAVIEAAIKAFLDGREPPKKAPKKA